MEGNPLVIGYDDSSVIRFSCPFNCFAMFVGVLRVWQCLCAGGGGVGGAGGEVQASVFVSLRVRWQARCVRWQDRWVRWQLAGQVGALAGPVGALAGLVGALAGPVGALEVDMHTCKHTFITYIPANLQPCIHTYMHHIHTYITHIQ